MVTAQPREGSGCSRLSGACAGCRRLSRRSAGTSPQRTSPTRVSPPALGLPLPRRNRERPRRIGAARCHEVVHRVIGEVTPERIRDRLVMQRERTLRLTLSQKLPVGIERLRPERLISDATPVPVIQRLVELPLPDDAAGPLGGACPLTIHRPALGGIVRMIIIRRARKELAILGKRRLIGACRAGQDAPPFSAV